MSRQVKSTGLVDPWPIRTLTDLRAHSAGLKKYLGPLAEKPVKSRTK